MAKDFIGYEALTDHALRGVVREALKRVQKCICLRHRIGDNLIVARQVAREKHDLRFDIPCLGPQTLETCAAAHISVLAFEAGKSLLLEQEACEELANKNKISLVTV